ncbi:hypothetical protein pb186bvf_016633 [Paramecium bursaria]
MQLSLRSSIENSYDQYTNILLLKFEIILKTDKFPLVIFELIKLIRYNIKEQYYFILYSTQIHLQSIKFLIHFEYLRYRMIDHSFDDLQFIKQYLESKLVQNSQYVMQIIKKNLFLYKGINRKLIQFQGIKKTILKNKTDEQYIRNINIQKIQENVNAYNCKVSIHAYFNFLKLCNFHFLYKIFIKPFGDQAKGFCCFIKKVI